MSTAGQDRGRRVRVTGGWRNAQVPEHAVYVGRPAPGLQGSPYANPFPVRKWGLDRALQLYREHLAAHPDLVARARRELAGRDLACWCPPEQDCHAEILLDVTAGREPSQPPVGAEDYDRQAGLAFRAGDLAWAVEVLQRARLAYPERGAHWDARTARVQAAKDRQPVQATLFDREAAT